MLSVPRSERRSIDALLQRAPGRLALELDNGLAIISRANSYLRDFVPESLEYFESTKIFSAEGDRLLPKTKEEYMRERLDSKTWVCQVARSEFVELMAGVADLVAGLHDDGRIHGDLKPSNLLATRDELMVIDSLELEEGVRTPALTPDWAAPEQILGDPVAKTTDQYPVGLMLLKLVNGALYGEEARFAVPTLDGKIARFTLLRNPGVFIPRDCVTDVGSELWNGLLRRCVQFDHRKRFPSMRALANEIRRLNAAHPAEGFLQFDLNFGILVEALVDGKMTAAWITHLRSTSN
jgi:serine/threonine protein kinase